MEQQVQPKGNNKLNTLVHRARNLTLFALIALIVAFGILAGATLLSNTAHAQTPNSPLTQNTDIQAQGVLTNTETMTQTEYIEYAYTQKFPFESKYGNAVAFTRAVVADRDGYLHTISTVDVIDNTCVQSDLKPVEGEDYLVVWLNPNYNNSGIIDVLTYGDEEYLKTRANQSKVGTCCCDETCTAPKPPVHIEPNEPCTENCNPPCTGEGCNPPPPPCTGDECPPPPCKGDECPPPPPCTGCIVRIKCNNGFGNGADLACKTHGNGANQDNNGQQVNGHVPGGAKLLDPTTGTPADTGKPEIKPDTGKPETKPDTGKPETKPDTGKPETKPDTGKPETKTNNGKGPK